MTPIVYCENRSAHLNCTLIVSAGEKKYLLNGKTYTHEQFTSTYPLASMRVEVEPDRKLLKGKNPDGTKDWML